MSVIEVQHLIDQAALRLYGPLPVAVANLEPGLQLRYLGADFDPAFKQTWQDLVRFAQHYGYLHDLRQRILHDLPGYADLVDLFQQIERLTWVRTPENKTFGTILAEYNVTADTAGFEQSVTAFVFNMYAHEQSFRLLPHISGMPAASASGNVLATIPYIHLYVNIYAMLSLHLRRPGSMSRRYTPAALTALAASPHTLGELLGAFYELRQRIAALPRGW